MSLDPIKTFKELNIAYREFLNAQFTFRNPEINMAAQAALTNESEFLNGPFIEAAMPYEGTHTLEDLVNSGLINKNISKSFTADEFSKYKRYNHQEKAFTLTKEGKSIIVASGTGSGKTECFLVPIINELLDEIDAGKLSSGVRALIVYPMNALANDQMARLRTALKDLKNITFGRYIGETPQNRVGDFIGKQKILSIKQGRELAAKGYILSHDGEQPLDNELLTRAEMEDTPPNILITNYAMLERMLLSAKSQAIFKGKYNKCFKFLVLDEAHTYKGAHGTEVAMLIRRLKDAIFNKIDNCLTCIGTSATLSSGEYSLNSVIKFAQDLFNEKFDKEQIIMSDRKTLEEVPKENIQKIDYYNNLFREYEDKEPDEKSSELFKILKDDFLVYVIRKYTLGKSITLDELTKKVENEIPSIKNEKLKETITQIIELCGEAISTEDGNPLINAKYHVFARALEGGFICFNDGYKVFTERRKEYEGHPVYELLNCMKCGQEYISGRIVQRIDDDQNVDDYLEPTEDSAKIFMVDFANSAIDVDEDDIDAEDKTTDTDNPMYLLCPDCGKLLPAGVKSDCTCGCSNDKFIRLTEIPRKSKKDTCYKCGKFNKGTIRSLTTSEDASSEMLTRKLYQILPEEKVEKKKTEDVDIFSKYIHDFDDEIAKGRRLLTFSDNRQAAARFAVAIQNRYNDWIWKNIIYNQIENMSEDKIGFKILADRCYKEAKNKNLFYKLTSEEDKQLYAQKQVLKEILEIEPRMSLNRLGMIDIKLDIVDLIDKQILDYFVACSKLDEEDTKAILLFIFDSLRRQGCVSFPDGIVANDDIFEPKNRDYYFKQQGHEVLKNGQVVGILPSVGTNVRLNYLQKVYVSKGYDADSAKVQAKAFLDEFSKLEPLDYFCLKGILCKDSVHHYFKIKLDLVLFQKQKEKLYVCEQCGETVKDNRFHICTKTNCDGIVVENIDNKDRGDYYRKSFSNIKIIPMRAEEHTAQIGSNDATNIQELFKNNEVNILSCSTTFEMGVDIGALESVFLLNVPPETSNYIQRAGRAGRRGSSAAFIVTYAKRRSHDLTYYNDPRAMIDGIIKAPYIELNNAYLIRRHIHSVIFSYLSRKYNFTKSRDFIDCDGEVALMSKHDLSLYLSSRPTDLLESIKDITPDSVKDELGVNNNWDFVKYLINDENDGAEGSYDVAIDNYLSLVNDLIAEEQNASNKGRYDLADKFKNVINTLNSKDWINFLAETNVLPRYGFPVYVVPLEINKDETIKNSLELERDLRMAITEYAPGTQVVAAGRYWRPYALKKQASKGWPTFDFSVCKNCQKVYFYDSAFGADSSARMDSCECGCGLSYKQMIVPKFGFITKNDDNQKTKKEENKYSSVNYFDGFNNQSTIVRKEESVGARSIVSEYSSGGKMYVLNRGLSAKNRDLGMPLFICSKCGYAYYNLLDDYPKSHKTANGATCTTKLLPAYLGHNFISDVLVLTIPAVEWLNEYESVLYAIIEGACKYMDLDRREIGGSIWNNGENGVIKIALFDTVPNGAGHVKRLQNNIKEIFNAALKKVDGTCGCGEETCCYGCLRNYDNQQYHDSMSRGNAFKYLSMMTSKK